MVMDLDFLQEFFVFSDIVFLFYVSGFELFLDFDVSECSEVLFVDVVFN